MKVVLIQLPSPWLINDRDLPLLGILYLAAALRQERIEVQIADLIGLPEKFWFIPEGDVYGISLVTPQAQYAKRVIQYLRSRTEREVIIAVGGPHVSALPQWSLDNLGADYAFVGEADVEFPRFIDEGASSSQKIIRCKPVDVAQLALPARDLVDIRSFHGGGINKYVKDFRYEGYMSTGRGCPWNCAFCAQRCITMGKVRQTPIASVVREVLELVWRYECDLVYFEDDTFNLSKRRVLALCDEFSRIEFNWHCLCRVNLIDSDMLAAMKNAGCKNITFGFESGSNHILKLMNKYTTVEMGIRAAELVGKAGMTVRGQMIIGFPGETDETMAETETFIRNTPIAKWGLHAFVPLPGSDVWNYPEKYGWEIAKEDEDFTTGFHTIGRSGEWSRVWSPKTRDWLAHLRQVVNERIIDQ